ncbi:hypothetical protein J2T56_003087 [Natronobacillus azotifigens]
MRIHPESREQIMENANKSEKMRINQKRCE